MKLGRLAGSTWLPVRITYEKIRALKLRAARNRTTETLRQTRHGSKISNLFDPVELPIVELAIVTVRRR